MKSKLQLKEELDAILEGYDSGLFKSAGRTLCVWDSNKNKIRMSRTGKSSITLLGLIGSFVSLSEEDGYILIIDKVSRYEKDDKGRRILVPYDTEWELFMDESGVLNAKNYYAPYEKSFLDNIEIIKNQPEFNSIASVFGVLESDSDEVIANKLSIQYSSYWYDDPAPEEEFDEISIVHYFDSTENAYMVKAELLINGILAQPLSSRIEVWPMNGEAKYRKYGCQGNGTMLLTSDLRRRESKFDFIRMPKTAKIRAEVSYINSQKEKITLNKEIDSVDLQRYLETYDYKGSYIQ